MIREFVTNRAGDGDQIDKDNCFDVLSVIRLGWAGSTYCCTNYVKEGMMRLV